MCLYHYLSVLEQQQQRKQCFFIVETISFVFIYIYTP